MKRIFHVLAAAFVSGFLCSPAWAGDADAFVPAAPPPSDPWEFTLTPYAWAAGLGGDIGIGNAVADVDLSFGDILEDLDVAAMAQFEARKGRWGLLFDGFWLKLSDSATTPGPLFGGATVEVEELRLEAMFGYRVLEGATTLDLLAGASYFSIDTDLDLVTRGGIRRRSFSDDWFDPMVGIRLHQEFSERWFGVLRAEVGGFGVGSDLTWQALAGVGFRAGESTTVFLGYRHLEIDYRDGGFLYDTETSGVLLGLQFEF